MLSVSLRSVCNTLSRAALLDCTVSKHTRFTRQGYAADPDRCNFCPIRLPLVFRFSHFLPSFFFSFVSHSGSLRPVDKFPSRVSSRLFFLLFFLASSWWETLYPRNSEFFSFPLSFRFVFFSVPNVPRVEIWAPHCVRVCVRFSLRSRRSRVKSRGKR